ncbi:MAG: GNAT family N-acetyltransferase [Chloroflexi bacterium]|nr:GNAT family N-acetyltransferase [Chloroflexota bacterium]
MPRPYLDGLSATATASRWRAAVAHEELMLLMATRSGRPVGLLVCGPSAGAHDPPGIGEIYQLFMDPSEFGSGAAHALFAAGARALRSRGFGELVLWVLERNTRARRSIPATAGAPTARVTRST